MGKFVIPSRGNCGKGCVALNPPPGRSQGKHLLRGCCRDFWMLWETKDMLFLQKEEDWELRKVGCVLWRGVGCGRRSQGSYPSKCWQIYSMEALGWGENAGSCMAPLHAALVSFPTVFYSHKDLCWLLSETYGNKPFLILLAVPFFPPSFVLPQKQQDKIKHK